MKGIFIFFCLSNFLVLFLRETEAAQLQSNGIYIVYMGASVSSKGNPRNDRDQILSSLKRKKNAVIHSYSNGFTGFAAYLSEEEAESIAQRPGVVSVFPDPVLQLHTTHSWDFLKYQTAVEIDSNPSSTSGSFSNGTDTIIGILDTGIWPESQSFSDEDMGPIPSQWKGKCMEGQDFTSSSCNRKLIGARYYDEPGSSNTGASGTPRDKNGHGTHVASTAAGIPVKGASYYGLAEGTAKGGSPGSRIAMYRVCTPVGCRGSAILKAFDDAIADGVDVLSLSLGASAGFEQEFSEDPIAIGAFHAVEKGIIVMCSAGNEGPDSKTVVNIAPWILTVAATTIDRDFESDVVLGGNKVIKGGGINFADIQKSPVYPLIYGSSAKPIHTLDDSQARNCVPGSFQDDQVKGKIILCESKDEEYSAQRKFESLKKQGAIGLIMINDDERAVASTFGSSPVAVVTEEDGARILSYINLTSNPVATILPTVVVTKYKPAPVVAYFSSRGPSFSTKNLLKPDIAAPGVAILAAWPGNDTKAAVSGKGPPLYYVLSGTSMSCPHVSGVAATVRSLHPTWSPSAVKSAIMTSAIQTNNLQAPITTNSGSTATPYDIGAGEVSTSGPLQPGLVYETGIADYLQYLCSTGYNKSKINKIASSLPANFSCSINSNSDSVSNMNYPSIAISNLKENESKKVIRTVTNVDQDESVYTALIDAPSGVDVEVEPNKLQFTKNSKKVAYEVTFRLTSSTEKDIFGSITWTNGNYKVRSPFVVSSIEQMPVK
ncbi:CO(2)-response secreted protease [Forsythia ovata]|uniref:CO(2)-response secreted protease n=1 Tax=Forsythia ovata TaxID=205694 RepID=A0ABD1PWG3_9LAMI